MLDVPPAPLAAASSRALRGFAADERSRAYVAMPREGTRMQTRWSCLGVRVVLAVAPAELALLTGSHRSHFEPPPAVLAGDVDEMLTRSVLQPGDVVFTAATTRFRPPPSAALATGLVMCEFAAGGQPHRGVSHQGGLARGSLTRPSAPTEDELPP